MTRRLRLDDVGYKTDVDFVPTGCGIFDRALNGGWARGRVVNVVGDTSTGKTLLAIEACANFARIEPKGEVHYAECEAAFDKSYAERLGLPKKRVKFYEDDDLIHTVEDLHNVLDTIAARKGKNPVFFVLDSLDSIGDEAEKEREFGEGTYGMAKAKLLSEMFRRLVKPLRDRDVTVMVISQIRDSVGVTFGKKQRRSGGRALDFYASQIVWLAHMGRIVQTRNKVKRAVGVEVLAKVTKNKVGPPFREARFPIRFDYGIEDAQAGLKWLIEHGKTKTLDLTEKDAAALLRKLPSMDEGDYERSKTEIDDAVESVWADVESGFRPARRKYS